MTTRHPMSPVVLLRASCDARPEPDAALSNAAQPYYCITDLARTRICDHADRARIDAGIACRVSGLCPPDYVSISRRHGKAPVGPSYLSDANSLFGHVNRSGIALCVATIAATFTSILQNMIG